jgi:hypothetical protein
VGRMIGTRSCCHVHSPPPASVGAEWITRSLVSRRPSRRMCGGWLTLMQSST